MLSWIVGRGGLLGSALAHELGHQFDATPVPWGTPTATVSILRSDLARFSSTAGDDGWAIIWAAGRGVVASSANELAT